MSVPPILTLTDCAAARLKTLMRQAQPPAPAVRLKIKNSGCAGMSYDLSFIYDISPEDELIQEKDVKLCIDSAAVLFLIGTEMDFKTQKLSSSFVFRNPNQTSACGCGESVLLAPVARPKFSS